MLWSVSSPVADTVEFTARPFFDAGFLAIAAGVYSWNMIFPICDNPAIISIKGFGVSYSTSTHLECPVQVTDQYNGSFTTYLIYSRDPHQITTFRREGLMDKDRTARDKKQCTGWSFGWIRILGSTASCVWKMLWLNDTNCYIIENYVRRFYCVYARMHQLDFLLEYFDHMALLSAESM